MTYNSNELMPHVYSFIDFCIPTVIFLSLELLSISTKTICDKKQESDRKMQAKKELEEYLVDTLVNKLIESRVPNSCKKTPCILGIDEAGRGPVLGPMTYAIAFYPKKSEKVLSGMKFADSKELSEATREKLFETLQTGDDGFQDLGFKIKIISPNMISNSMLRRKKYNLNALSHDTAIDLIKSCEASGIEIEHVYIDTVGPPLKYMEKLKRFFPKYQFTVTEKADSKYAIVSAASVCAKVMRDRIVQNWKYAEADSLRLDTFELGSGYPADPGTKKFLEKSADPVFGYPTLARFSWSTITKALEKHSCPCDWNEPEDEELDPKTLNKQQNFMKSFFQKRAPPTKAPTNGSNKASISVNVKASSDQTRTNADKFFQERSLKRIQLWD